MDVISLYDYTGEMLRPWARFSKVNCYAYDLQHNGSSKRHGINYVHADLHNENTLWDIVCRHNGKAAIVFGFPVCTDLAVSGARHFASKAAADPMFQKRAALHAQNVSLVAEALNVPYMVENPVSRLATLWRKPDHTFDPFEYGGYLSDSEAEHPRWPEYIAPRDGYSKRTCLWTGNGFIMPDKRPVECEAYGRSRQWGKLGGKSAKTKNIRSATPRGFAKAVACANMPVLWT
jgi:hypothetical protein